MKNEESSKKANRVNKTFNIVIAGTGGQGLITLLQVMAEAAIIQGFDVKTSELHGLSQRGGSISTHVRIGDKVYSPLVSLASADLILSLEMLETLRVIDYANPQTKFLINCYSLPFVGTISEKEIEKKMNKLIKGEKHIISASGICREELGKEVLGGIYLISYAAFKKMIPLKPSSIEKAISRIIPKLYLDPVRDGLPKETVRRRRLISNGVDMNLKAFKLAGKDAYAN